MQTDSPPRSIYFVLLIGLIAVSFAAILIRYAQQENVPSLYIAAFRLVGAATLLTPITLIRHQEDIRTLPRADWFLAALGGVFLAAHFAFWTLSLEYTTVLISVTLVTTAPIWTALIEGIFLRHIPRPLVIIGIAVTLVGGIVLALPSDGASVASIEQNRPVLGGALATMGAIAVAIYLTVGRKLRAELALLPYIWIVYGIGGIVLIPVLILRDIPLVGYSPEAYFWLMSLAIVPQLIGHSSLNYAVKFVSATYLMVLSKLEPIISATVAYFAFSELPGQWEVIGSVVILVGVIIASLPRQQPKQTPHSALS